MPKRAPTSAASIPSDQELVNLLQLARKQLSDTSTLISDIKSAIKQQHVPETQHPFATIFFDESSGHIRLLIDDQDQTTPEFQTQAASTARRFIIQLLSYQPIVSQMPPQQQAATTSNSKIPSIARWLTKLIFWTYNGIFIFTEILMLITLFDPDAHKNFLDLLKNSTYYQLTWLTILYATPPVATILTLRHRLRNSARFLAMLFCIIEIPLILISAFALSLSTDPLPIIWLILMVSVAAVIFTVMSFLGIQPQTRIATMLHLAIGSIIASTFAYLSLLISFFIPVIIGAFWTNLFSLLTDPIYPSTFVSSPMPQRMLLVGMFLVVFIIMTVLIALPYILTYRSFQTLSQSYTKLTSYWPTKHTNTFLLGILAGYLLLIVGLSYQPNISRQIELLASHNLYGTYEHKADIARQLLPHKQQLKDAIDAYTQSQSRYPFYPGQKFLANWYEEIFHVSPATGERIQKIFFNAAAPFVFQTKIDRPYELRTAYQYLFPTIPEQTPVKPNINLSSRAITATHDNSLAQITITEEYANTTNANQEVIYEFFLPITAAITELKLGPNLEFTGLIAPKGAATQTYERELNQRRDPALLEQLGPRQYRLRVFPIPGKNDMTTLKGLPQKIQFTYSVIREPQGFALPQYTRTDNLSLDNTNATFTLNNQTQTLPPDNHYIADSQIPSPCTPPTGNATTVIGLNNQIAITPNQPGWDITCKSALQPQTFSALANRRIAFIHDTSTANQDSTHPTELFNFFTNYPNILSTNHIDLFFYNDRLSQPTQLTPENLNILQNIVYFGPKPSGAATQTIPNNYDSLIVLAASDTNFKPNGQIFPQTKIYTLHPSGKIPTYPFATTTTLLQHQGYTTDSVTETFLHLTSAYNQTTPPVTLTPYWNITNQFTTTNTSPSSQPIAAHAHIHNLLANTVGINDPTKLDTFHELAIQNKIVTPISSLIALVNQQQLDTLERLSESNNRYIENFNANAQRSNQAPIWGPTSRPNNFEDLRVPMTDVQQFNIGPSFGLSAPMAYDSTGSRFGYSPFGATNIQGLLVIHLILFALGITAWVGYQIFHKLRHRNLKNPL